MSQLHWRPCQAFMTVSVQSVHRASPPPGPTAIRSIFPVSRCAGLKLRTKRL